MCSKEAWWFHIGDPGGEVALNIFATQLRSCLSYARNFIQIDSAGCLMRPLLTFHVLSNVSPNVLISCIALLQLINKAVKAARDNVFLTSRMSNRFQLLTYFIAFAFRTVACSTRIHLRQALQHIAVCPNVSANCDDAFHSRH